MGAGDRVLNLPGRLNGICPYFTMFPLDFPYRVLSEYAKPGQRVIDPFCGRGTTNYAARLLGLSSVGIDSSPVAAALSEAKIAQTRPGFIVAAAKRILESVSEAQDVPIGEFWQWAFHPDVLNQLCRLREGLLANCRSDTRKALRAILLGTLHGPRPKHKHSYFSNQCQRTYAPKPDYAVRFWKARELKPPLVDVLGLIEEKAQRYYSAEPISSGSKILCADSRKASTFTRLKRDDPFQWVITSPPYYGMRTYIPDQWLRFWFLGGPPEVVYISQEQLQHTGADLFAQQLSYVWKNLESVSLEGTQMIIRFGGIHDRKVEPLELLNKSLNQTRWKVHSVHEAGSAEAGRRQALHFSIPNKGTLAEHDVCASLEG